MGAYERGKRRTVRITEEGRILLEYSESTWKLAKEFEKSFKNKNIQKTEDFKDLLNLYGEVFMRIFDICWNFSPEYALEWGEFTRDLVVMIVKEKLKPFKTIEDYLSHRDKD